MISHDHAHEARRSLAGLAIVALLAGQVPGWAGAQEDFSGILDKAGMRYAFAEYQEALDLLERIPDSEAVSAKTVFDVHVLRGRCLVGLGNTELARESFCNAHLLDREWTPDPVVFQPGEIEVFTSSLDGCKAGGGTPWGWIVAGGAVVAGAVVLLVGGGSDNGGSTDPATLPGFPDMPAEPGKAGGDR